MDLPYTLLSILIGIVLMLVGWVLTRMSKMDETLDDIKTLCTDLHVWHGPDASGRMLWKVDPEEQRRLFDRVLEESKESKLETRKVVSAVQDIATRLRNRE